MGVKYLKSFLYNYHVPLLEDIDISDTTLVIDGSELLYELYFKWGNLDVRCGGEYGELRQISIDFFKTLRQCNIKYYVVFDRFKAQNNVPRYLEARNEKLAAMGQLVESGQSDANVKVLPLMGRKTLQQTLLEESVPFVVTPGDGDATISAIANELNAFVLATDTDFCIYDLNQGFLFMDDFQWKDVLQNKDTLIRGKIFRRAVLNRVFGTPLESLPFLEPLLSSQDGIPNVDFLPFLKRMSQEVSVPANLRPRDHRRRGFILSILLWLKANYRDDENVIRLITRKIPRLPENEFRDCLQTYRILPDVRSEMAQLYGNRTEKSILSPFVVQIRSFSMPSRFLPIVPDDQSKPPAHDASSKIRKSLYEIMLWLERLSGREGNTNVLEGGREGHNFRSKILNIDVDERAIAPLDISLDGGELELRENVMNARRSFFLKSIDSSITPEDLADINELLALSMKFWVSLEGDKPSKNLRIALAITITCLYHDISDNDSFPEDAFSKVALHATMRWQTCIDEMMELNQILGYPLVTPLIGRTFSGKILQKAYQFVSDGGSRSVNDVSSFVFGGNQDAQTFFSRIYSIMDC